MNKLILSTLLILLIIAGLIYFSSDGSNSPKQTSSKATILDENNKQIIELKAKGGYSPAIVNAEANKETILRIKTNNTFDCSSALVIPSLNVRKMLPPTGSTDIFIGTPSPGTQIDGTCSMGMYRFSIKFI